MMLLIFECKEKNSIYLLGKNENKTKKNQEEKE